MLTFIHCTTCIFASKHTAHLVFTSFSLSFCPAIRSHTPVLASICLLLPRLALPCLLTMKYLIFTSLIIFTFLRQITCSSPLESFTSGISNLLSLNEKQDEADTVKSLHPVILRKLLAFFTSLSLTLFSLSLSCVPLASSTVPGYMGSQLQVTLDRENTVSPICTKKSDSPSTLWLSLLNHQPLQEDCWLENAALHYDACSGKTFSDTGVNVSVKAFASTEAIEFIAPPPQATSQSE